MLYATSYDSPKSNLIKVRTPRGRPLNRGLGKSEHLNKRHYIRHPDELPISYRRARCAQASVKTFVENPFVGLSFVSQEEVEPGTILDVTIKVECEDHTFQGQVVWIRYLDQRFELGLCFANEDDAFQVRMIEQVCHIEIYRRKIRENDGRAVDLESAAQEWIEKFSAQFPKLLAGP